ncbi:MAG: hypothetical protein E7623_00060 [Ruminococcaceae bacterium]|nr:hypothetical protein [Oscillospiraceae bacterium]
MFITFLIEFFFGYYSVRIKEARAAAQFLFENSIPYWGLKKSDEYGVFNVRKSVYRAYCEKFESKHTEILKEYGIPKLLRAYRKRIGIPLGGAVFIFLLWFSTNFIWDMDIKGNVDMTEDEVREILSSYGCGIGAYIPDIDLYKLCNSCMLSSDKIAWISVNMKGTVAHVELIETKFEEKNEEYTGPCNLVASSDGIISYFTVFDGDCVVESGDEVKKGELLVSGVRGDEDGFGGLVSAKGSVYAMTVHTLSVSTAYEHTEKVPTGREISFKTANIFGKSIKLYPNSRNLPEDCGTIYNEENGYLSEKINYRLILFGVIELPIIISGEKYLEFEERTLLLSDAEALAEAKEKLAEEKKHCIGDADVLSRSLQTEIYEENGKQYIRLTAEYRCLENIAVQSPIFKDGK